MTMSAPLTMRAAVLVAVSMFVAATCAAQDNRSPGGLLNNLFNRGEQQAQAEPQGDTDLVVRLDRLENQIRQLTGAIEQLQFRNQQLEQQLKRMQDDSEFRFQQLGSKAAPPQTRSAPPPLQAAPPPAQAPASGRRSDVFDPSQHPNSPGAPRALGGGPAVPGIAPIAAAEDAAVGAPGGRAAGAPLDLSTLAGNAPGAPEAPRAAPPADRRLATLPPSQTPKDEYDLAYGYVLRKDYALAEQGFRDYLRKYRGDKAEPDAHYWLGETYFQRQRYQDAADSFLVVVRNFESSGKAPDALLRLGQSLAALGQKELACASYGEIARKYPRASGGVKRTVEQEQKRAKC